MTRRDVNQVMMGILLVGFVLIGTMGYAATVTVNPGESIQAAIDAASPGDTIILNAGTYEEDINIGEINTPGNRKDNITLKAADGAKVEVKIPNESSRLLSLGALGADFGPSDRMGFLVYGENVTVEGITFVQISEEVNNFSISVLATVISNNVTFRNCEFAGLGVELAGDVVGLAITPLDAVTITQGQGGLASNLTVENCTFHDIKFPYGNANFLLELGLPAPSPEATLSGCEFFNNGTCINMDDGIATIIDCNFHDNVLAIDASDDGVNVKNCRIENNLEDGIEISDSESEEDEPETNPVVNIENCIILNNGAQDGDRGLDIEHGTITVTNTVIAGSAGANVYIDPPALRNMSVTFDHCDLYNSQIGIALETSADAEDIAKVTMTNTNIVDVDGIVNNAGPLSEIKLEFCNIFVTGDAFVPDQEFIDASDIINVDPLYTDAANGDFSLQAGSPVATAGKEGTFIGSQGLITAIHDWMIR